MIPLKKYNNNTHLAMITSKALAATTRTICEICTEPMSPKNFFKYNNDNNCNHPFCSNCISKYIRFQIRQNNVNIKCPASKCKQMLDPIMCNSIVSRQLLGKWCDGLCASTLPEVECRFYCPYEDCKELIINECGIDERKVNCPNCKKYLCFKCQVPWHKKGTNCEKNKNNNLFSQLARRSGWRRCPACGYWVDRISGCCIIRCRCGASFCYGCGVSEERHLCGAQPNRQPQSLQLIFWHDFICAIIIIFFSTLLFVV